MTQNINIHGGNIAGLQVGNNNNQTITQTIGGAEPSVPAVFEAIEKSLPDDVAEDVAESVLRPLQTMAELPAAEQKTPDIQERAQSLISRLVPYAPQIAKSVSIFGSAALTAFASSNPIVAGLLAICKATAGAATPASGTPPTA